MKKLTKLALHRVRSVARLDQISASALRDNVEAIARIVPRTYRAMSSWLSMPWSVQRVVLQDERKWRKFNRYRKELAHSRIERELFFAGEHPLRFSLSLFALVVAYWTLFQLLPPDWFTATWGKWTASEQLTHFSTLWSVQTTFAAMVYPITIAFVTVFLQRRPAAETFVHLYMLDTGALAAGLSSVALVLVMAAQYFLLPSYGTAWLPMWVALDAGWFLLNTALTVYFLFRTVEFLRPEVQQQVIQRYAVAVALPRDVMRLNAFQVFAQAQKNGWIPAPCQFEDAKTDGPKVLLGTFGFRTGDIQGTYRLREPSRLIDVRFFPLRTVIASWMYAARKWPKPSDDENRMFAWPLLTVPVTPGRVYRDSPPLAKVDSGPQLHFWQRWLFNFAYIYQPLRKERLGIQVKAILDELEADARVAAGRADVEAFERAYETLTDLHKLLLGACLAKSDDGNIGSWALLPDMQTFTNRALHVDWSDAYRSVFSAAIGTMLSDTRPARRLCYLVQRLSGEDLYSSPLEIREHIMKLPPLMMYQLGAWWAKRVEEQGVMTHGPHNMAVLRAPFHRVYEEVISTFIGGWEGARKTIAKIPDASEELDWLSIPTLARLNATHIEETARMLLSAVTSGDRIAAEWFADALSKWWGSNSYENEPFALYGKTKYLTLDHLNIEWDTLSNLIDLDEQNVRWSGGKSAMQRGILLAVLYNFWNDIRLLVLELLLSYAVHDESPSPTLEESLTLEIAAGMLGGKQWHGGGTLSHPLSDFSPSSYLNAKIRQYVGDGQRSGGYIGRLDGFVERIKNMERPHMVTSRTYSFSGADDVASLQGQQLMLFLALSNAKWAPSESLRYQIGVWMSDQYHNIETLRYRIPEWLQHLEKQEEISTKVLPALMHRLKREYDSTHALRYVKDGLEAWHTLIESKRTELLAAEPVDTERLAEMSNAASRKGFNIETGEFPLQLFGAIKFTPASLENVPLKVKEIRKGELTRREMDQRAVNEGEYWATTIAQRVAIVLLTDVLARCAKREAFVPSAETYWATLKVEAAAIRARGEQPILLLNNATRPEWIWQWQHADFGSRHIRPDDLRVQRHDGRGHSYVCTLNEIDVFVAPIRAGKSILIAKESFKAVTFQEFSQGRFVDTTIDNCDDAKLLVDLTLTFSRDVEVGTQEVVLLNYIGDQEGAS